jgi:hypothetical protein
MGALCEGYGGIGPPHGGNGEMAQMGGMGHGGMSASMGQVGGMGGMGAPPGDSWPPWWIHHLLTNVDAYRDSSVHANPTIQKLRRRC